MCDRRPAIHIVLIEDGDDPRMTELYSPTEDYGRCNFYLKIGIWPIQYVVVSVDLERRQVVTLLVLDVFKILGI